MNIKKDTIIRTVIFVISIINQVLAIKGKALLPITDTQVNLYISTAFSTITSFRVWWKNNSFTKSAIEADAFKEIVKDGGDIKVIVDGDNE